MSEYIEDLEWHSRMLYDALREMHKLFPKPSTEAEEEALCMAAWRLYEYDNFKEELENA